MPAFPPFHNAVALVERVSILMMNSVVLYSLSFSFHDYILCIVVVKSGARSKPDEFSLSLSAKPSSCLIAMFEISHFI